MFVQRMLKDPAFAAKVKEQQLIAASKGQNADPNVIDEATAQRYLDEDEAAQRREKTEVKPMTKEEAEGLERVDNRAEQVKVVAQSLAFVGLGVRAVAAGMLGATNDPEVAPRRRAQNHHRGRLRLPWPTPPRRPRAWVRGRRGGEMIDVETVEAMLGDVSIRWVAVEAASGRGVEQDGARLGVAAFSVAGNRCDVRRRVGRRTTGAARGASTLERVERRPDAAGAARARAAACRLAERRCGGGSSGGAASPLSVAVFQLGRCARPKFTRAARLVV